ncbi:winged helix-turn-helix domain-containing protein [Parabacteroides sp. OttesenSCG-928-G06]|nr:winged helix-turn-helix domain-containing protein [Parabacteroides sp. OttesenSCG-928-G06]
MLNQDIGSNAGDVYTLLSQKGKLSIRKIGELTYKRESVIFLALGWLLRENKIKITEQNGELISEISFTTSDMYY